MISRWSSPIPEIRVCPVSASDDTLKVGSSSASRPSDRLSLSSSALVFGSIATEITGSGKSIASSTIGRFASHSVSPVRANLRPTTAAMSPAPTLSISSRLFACIRRRRPTRSFFCWVEL